MNAPAFRVTICAPPGRGIVKLARRASRQNVSDLLFTLGEAKVLGSEIVGKTSLELE